MKGIIFTEFIDLVEDNFGYATVDKIIEKSDLASNGAYTAIGTYPHSEMVSLLSNLSSEINIPIPDLLKLYGKYIFKVLIKSYRHFVWNFSNAFQFLESIDGHVHAQMHKMHPDAELPKFETKRIDNNTLEMKYSSNRRMSDFAIGLIEACMEHYNEVAIIEKKDISGDGTCVLITIKKQ